MGSARRTGKGAWLQVIRPGHLRPRQNKNEQLRASGVSVSTGSLRDQQNTGTQGTKAMGQVAATSERTLRRPQPQRSRLQQPQGMGRESCGEFDTIEQARVVEDLIQQRLAPISRRLQLSAEALHRPVAGLLPAQKQSHDIKFEETGVNTVEKAKASELAQQQLDACDDEQLKMLSMLEAL